MLSRLVAIVAKRYIFDEHRQSLLVGALCVSLTVSIAHAYGFNVNALEPSTLFFQAGIGNQSTRAYIAGTTWNWAWSRRYSWLDASGFLRVPWAAGPQMTMASAALSGPRRSA